MGLHNTAHYLKSHGRGEDTELVHMTKGEVKGLEDLARAHKGSLSTNPSTGLKEAGFLSDILPTVVGAGVGIATGNPMIGAAVAGGLGYATSGGNFSKGLMSGIGAYGGAGLYGNLAGAGAATLGAEVSPIAAQAGTEALLKSGVEVGKSVLTPQEIGALVNSGALTQTEAAAYGNAYSNAFSTAGNPAIAGLSSPGALSNNLVPLSMLGISALGNFGSGSGSQSSISANPNPGYIRPYTFSQTKNPNYGQPGQAYFNQSYTAQTPIVANQFGSQYLPSSGMAAGGLAENEMFPQSHQDNTQFATPSQMPTSAEVIRSDYDDKTDPYTGQENGFAAGGMMQKGLGGYSDGGQLLKGPGDGVSDSIPAQIGHKQPARLADGEFVVPARIVSELGNGSTDAGARQLYKMMERIQAKRRKSKAVAANTKAYKDLPA
jgi:hypothetical protein